MGYEIRLILGVNQMHDWFRVLGTLELGKVNDNELGHLKSLLEKNEYGVPKVFFYESDGNTECWKDSYDDDLIPTSTSKVAKALEKDNEKYNNTELTAVVNFLKEISKNQLWAQCILFGH